MLYIILLQIVLTIAFCNGLVYNTEICTRDDIASRSFLSSRLVFQGPSIPPSNAVHGPVQRGHFWLARKGRTTFPFAFQIPEDAPSTINFQRLASLRYVITGNVQIFYSGREDTVFKSKEAFVVESWHRHRAASIPRGLSSPDEPFGPPTEAMARRRLFLGGPGALQLTVSLKQTVYRYGQNIPVSVHVRNDTRRYVQGIRIYIGHRLRIHLAGADASKAISQIVSEVSFDSSDFSFQPGIERSIVTHVAVPPKVRTSQQNSLFRIDCFMIVSCYIGPFSRDLSVELPIVLIHNASFNSPIDIDMRQNRYVNRYNLLDEEAILAQADKDAKRERRRRRRTKVAAEDQGDDALTSPSKEELAGKRILPWHTNEEQPPSGLGSQPSSVASSTSDLPTLDLPPALNQLSPPSLTELTSESDTEEGRLIAGSPNLGPASPITYMPAHERVRYAPFRVPSTRRAQQAPLRKLLYQYDDITHTKVPEKQEPEQNQDDTPVCGTPQFSSSASSGQLSESAAPIVNSPNATSAPIQITAQSPGLRVGHQLGSSPSSSPLQEEQIVAGSLPTNMESILHGPRRSFQDNIAPSPVMRKPRPLPVPPVRSNVQRMPEPIFVKKASDASRDLPTSQATEAPAPSGIARLIQWGASSLTQLVGGNTNAADTTTVDPPTQPDTTVSTSHQQDKHPRENARGGKTDNLSDEESEDEREQPAVRRMFTPRVIVARHARQPIVSEDLTCTSREHGVGETASRPSDLTAEKAAAAILGRRRYPVRPSLNNDATTDAFSSSYSPMSNERAHRMPGAKTSPVTSTDVQTHDKTSSTTAIKPIRPPNAVRPYPPPPSSTKYTTPRNDIVARPMTPKLREYMERYVDATKKSSYS
jgi:hypothetical protein